MESAEAEEILRLMREWGICMEPEGGGKSRPTAQDLHDALPPMTERETYVPWILILQELKAMREVLERLAKMSEEKRDK